MVSNRDVGWWLSEIPTLNQTILFQKYFMIIFHILESTNVTQRLGSTDALSKVTKGTPYLGTVCMHDPGHSSFDTLSPWQAKNKSVPFIWHCCLFVCVARPHSALGFKAIWTDLTQNCSTRRQKKFNNQTKKLAYFYLLQIMEGKWVSNTEMSLIINILYFLVCHFHKQDIILHLFVMLLTLVRLNQIFV